MGFLITFRELLWGMPTVVLLSAFGLYFTVRLRFYKINTLMGAFGRTFFSLKKGKNGGISSMAALSTALGGTVGVGSISGVALSISLGGAGSIFWMWVCSFLGMGLKYAEVAIAHRHRVVTARGPTGGAMYCLRAMGKPWLGVLFALLTVFAAVCGGSLVQAGAISDTMGQYFKSDILCALCVGAATLLVVCGGRSYITRFNTVALPAVSVLFTVLSLIVLVQNFRALPDAFARIFGEAFGYRQAVGGVSAAIMMRVGCARGTFSNEAGMGSSPLSYSAGAETDSHVQGLWGVTEVFIDSFVVSTLVALGLLCTGASSVFSVFTMNFGAVGGVFYVVSIVVFAFAAVVSWCFYGEEALYFLCPDGKKVFGFFRFCVALCSFAGALMTQGDAFAAADIWGALMLFPNLYLLFKTRSEIIELAK